MIFFVCNIVRPWLLLAVVRFFGQADMATDHTARKEKNMNAVIYARYSSTGQNEQSIDGQLRICKEFAESKGYNIIKTYIDKAKSAWSDSDKRVDFQNMISDASTETFQHIIVYKFDRFARNRLDSQMYKQRL